jgi:hypothetical protein
VQRLIDRVRSAVHDIDVSRHLLAAMSIEATSSGNALIRVRTPARLGIAMPFAGACAVESI